MDIRKLQRAIVDGLEDVKAQHINVFNTEHLSAMFERVIIASGTSNRQTKALAASVRDSVRSRDMQVMSTEGEDNGEWIIVDCGAAVVHIMQPAIREYYHLEEIWGGKSVNVKLGDTKVSLVKASEDASKPAKKVAAKKVAAKKAPAQRATAADQKAVAAKRAANQTAAAKRVATTRPVARKAAAPAAPARTVAKTAAKKAATKAPARRVAVKAAAPVKKAAARKTPRST